MSFLGSLKKVAGNVGNAVKKAAGDTKNAVVKAAVDTGHVAGKAATSTVGKVVIGAALAATGVGIGAAAAIGAASQATGELIKPGGNLGKAGKGAVTGAAIGAGSAVAGKVIGAGFHGAKALISDKPKPAEEAPPQVEQIANIEPAQTTPVLKVAEELPSKQVLIKAPERTATGQAKAGLVQQVKARIVQEVDKRVKPDLRKRMEEVTGIGIPVDSPAGQLGRNAATASAPDGGSGSGVNWGMIGLGVVAVVLLVLVANKHSEG